MTKKVLQIDTKAGIQRDGTVLDKQFYNDGEWVRFQRGRPRKIGGFRQMTDGIDGISRGIYVDSQDGYNTIFNGYAYGLEKFICDNNGIGAGVIEYYLDGGPILTLGTLTGGSTYTDATYTAVPLTGGHGFLALATIVISGNEVTTVTITTAGNGYVVGDALSANSADIGGTGSGFEVLVATVNSQFIVSQFNLWQFDGIFDATGGNNNLVVGHPGQNLKNIDSTINTAVLAGSPSGNVVYPLQDTQGTAPTGDFIEVSGGVVALHPYLFAYGNNGLIQNCSAGNVFDWNSPDTNAVNVSSQKVVKGMAVRGGSNAPAGLFWALDSLIRVSYSPTTISTGTGTEQLFWRYDIVGSSTILASSSVVEYDGIYFWIGVDRFFAYNGTIVDLPNSMNQNWFFDNLNYSQRQKIWGTKVPRFGEVWWFYPRGDATECNDVIIYNVREKTWYDAGSSVGATRSAGYYSQVFHYPVMAGLDLSVSQDVLTQDVVTTDTSNVIVTTVNNALAIGLNVSGVGIPVGSVIVSIAPTIVGGDFVDGYCDITISNDCTEDGTVLATFSTVSGKVSLWQHEIGTDKVYGQNQTAIRSMFQTNDLGLVTGGPAQPSPIGDNMWLHLERVEPDFVQSGEMELYVTGRPYAQAEDATTGPYLFNPDTHKIDMREQRRELRLQFVSNVQGGNYQLGTLLLSVNVGDVRGY